MIGSRSRISSFLYGIFTIVAAIAVLIIARSVRMTFPNPWNDEARFYLPSWNFAQSGSLSPDILNAPQGIYWVPDGFYVWMGTLLTLFSPSIYVAQLIGEISVAISISIFVRAFLKITESTVMAAIFSLILISPPVIFAANMVRMEALLCLLFATTVWLHTNRAYLAAASLLLLSILVHPAFTFAFIAYVAALAATGNYWTDISQQPWKTTAERILFLFVLLALFAELARIAHHLRLFQQHMSYQAARKISINRSKVFDKPQAILFYLETITTVAALKILKPKIALERRLILPLIAATLGMQAYAFLGGETAYDVYSLSIGPSLWLCLVYRITTLS